MIPNPLAITRGLIEIARGMYADYMWTWTTATQGAEAAERWRR